MNATVEVMRHGCVNVNVPGTLTSVYPKYTKTYEFHALVDILFQHILHSQILRNHGHSSLPRHNKYFFRVLDFAPVVIFKIFAQILNLLVIN